MAKLTNDKVLKALQEYCENPRLVFSKQDARPESLNRIPESWWPLLSLDNVDTARLAELWQPLVKKLPMTFEEVAARLHGLAVLEEAEAPPSLLYIFTYENGQPTFNRGLPPLEEREIPDKFQDVWPRLPKAFREAYGVHNGWFLLSALSGGYWPVEEWMWLNVKEWGLDEDTLKALPFDPGRTVFVHTNGGSGYLGFELPPGKGEVKPVRWWTDAPEDSRVGISFWDELDSSTAIGLEEVALVEE